MVKTFILPIQSDSPNNHHFYMQPLNYTGSENDCYLSAFTWTVDVSHFIFKY